MGLSNRGVFLTMHIEDQVREIIEIFELDVKDISNVPESNSSKVYLLTLSNDEKVILKIPYNIKKLKRELRALQLLENKTWVPDLLNIYHGDARLPGALLLSYIVGTPLSGQVTESIAHQMGILLASIHSIPSKKFLIIDETGEQDTDDVWINYKKNAIEKSVPFCEQVIKKAKLEKCLNFFDYYFNNFPSIDGPCLVHNDFRMGNVLINDSKVVGVIDFEVAGGGCANSDFSLVKTEVWDVCPGTKASFLAGYSTIRKVPNLEETLPFYVFHAAFTRIAFCIKRGLTNEKFYFDYHQQIDDILKTSCI